MCQRDELIKMIINSLNIFPTQFFTMYKHGQFQHVNL